MFGQWKLQYFDPGQGKAAGAQLAEYDHSAWIDVDVPGDVHQALMAAGVIEDPFYDRNEETCAWMEDKEWWIRTRFTGPQDTTAQDERRQLIFHGLDTYATVWLNGEELGRHRNMFRPAVFDVTATLRPGEENVLALRFDRPLDQIAEFDISHWWQGTAPRVAMRKAQFGYGWDWGPRLPTVGIWREVEIRHNRRAALAGVHFYTVEIDADHAQAVVAVRVEAERIARAAELGAHVRLADGGATAVEGELALRDHGSYADGILYLTVKEPKLWWTHDLGEPHLYALHVDLLAGGEVVERQTVEAGIRTIELDQSPDPDEPGTRFFRFVLNGVPIFAKGADWIPAHSFVGGLKPARYGLLLTMARDANMNMLRIWGGGIYEHDAFYTICDRLGMLVWQDFMFACAMYPESPQWFVDEVRAEAEYQVRRLRGHPCMALWCGNNENQWLHERARWQQKDPIAPGALYYDQILPEAVARLDGRVPYWPGSPYGGNDYNSEADGDSHNWNVWHGNSPRQFGEEPTVDHSPQGVTYRRYAEDQSRFVSEFGMHAAPVFETLQRNIPADQLFHHSPSMDHHNKDNPKNKGDNLMLAITGLPETLAEYIDFSMAAQAEGLKFGIEHYRRRKPHCSGALFWQLNDCWPVLSWSVIDYYGFGKAGYYYARRVFAPVLASFKELPDGEVALWVTNDTLAAVHDRLDLRLLTFDGQPLWHAQIDAAIPANSSLEVWRGRVEGGPDRFLSVRGESIPRNRHFFADVKDLALPEASVSVEYEQVDAHRLEARLLSEQFAYFVHLSTGLETTAFSDNYFDLEPGVAHTITVSDAHTDLRPEQITVRQYLH